MTNSLGKEKQLEGRIYNQILGVKGLKVQYIQICESFIFFVKGKMLCLCLFIMFVSNLFEIEGHKFSVTLSDKYLIISFV